MTVADKSEVPILCPKCRSELGLLGSLPGRCDRCCYSIPFLHGVPILHTSSEVADLDYTKEPQGLIKQNILGAKIPFINQALEAGKLTLELGAGSDGCDLPNLIKTDYVLYSKRLDLCVDAHHLPFPDDTFDAVFSTAVFEHLHSPWDAAREIGRVLKPGGEAYTLCAFMQHLHGYPHHYFNMTAAGLKSLFCDLQVLDAGPSKHTTWGTLSVILGDLFDATKLATGRGDRLTAGTANKIAKLQGAICQIHENLEDMNDCLMNETTRPAWEKIAPAVEITARKAA